MFQLDKHDAKISNVNPRREKHGKTGRPGFDVRFTLTTPNTTLDSLQKGLKEALYRKVQKGEQLDAFQGAGDLVALRFPQMEPVKLEIELTGYEVCITGHLESSNETTLVDVKIDGFTIRPIEGGSAEVQFSGHVPNSEDVVNELADCVDWWMYESVRLSLIPPTQQASNDASDDASTSDEAKAEAERLIEAGKKAA